MRYEEWEDGFLEGQVVGLVRALEWVKRTQGTPASIIAQLRDLENDVMLERDIRRRGVKDFARTDGCSVPGFWRRLLAVWRAMR